MEPEKYYVGPSSPIFTKIGGTKKKSKGKEEANKKKKKRKLILNFYSVSIVSEVYINENV